MTGLPTGFRTLVRREVLRFVRRPYNTFLPPLITNVLYFSVFGVILGARIGPVGDVSYLQFVLPGLVVLGATSDAFQNASFTLFHGRWNEYIHESVTSPMSHSSMVGAYVVASMIRGWLVGLLIVGVGLAFTPVPIANPGYLLAFGLVITTLFASLGVVGGLWAEDFDHLTVMNQFLIRPLVFFGAVFYSLDVLPALWRQVTLLNPMVYMVNGVRFGMIGVTEIDPNTSLAVLTGATVFVIAVDVALFKRGYGITE